MLNKLREARQTAQDVDELIQRQKEEIKFLRAIVNRYHKTFGGKLIGGEIEPIKDTVSPSLSDNGKVISVEMLDYGALGMKSDYMDILQQLEKLNQ